MLLQRKRILGQRLGKVITLALFIPLLNLNVVFAEGYTCKAVIYPALVDNPRIRGSEVDFSVLDWSYSDLPLIAIEGNCSVSKRDAKSFMDDTSKTMVVTSSNYQNQGYFFYVGHCGLNSFCISWNGHRESTHAGWLITESAKLEIDSGNYCFRDQRVSVCLN